MRLNESMLSIGDSATIKKMLDQVNAQNVSIQSMNDSSRNLQESLNKISDEANHIKETTENAVKVSQTSIEHVTETINAVANSAAEVNSINDKAQFFHDKITEISSIIGMIKKISSQSSMLALNASIEAARAGESGKGFAVVANQMTELSKNTSQSAETIVKYVAELRDSIEELIHLVDSTTTHLNENNEMMQRSVTDFNTMTSQMDLINESINSIYNSVNTQSEVTDLFVKSMEDIADSYATLGEDCMNTGKHMYKISRYIDTARSDMARGFSNLSTQDWLHVFKVDHLIFTWRLYNNLAHFEHLKITQLNNPTGCKFGKWAGSQTDSRIKDNQIFKDLVMYHD
ncbi:MAG: chemotaxis protein, partial [Lachnospiraceae bacterium]|nr:chemotaxis protein [Lachnospiraceae bacterium]